MFLGRKMFSNTVITTVLIVILSFSVPKMTNAAGSVVDNPQTEAAGGGFEFSMDAGVEAWGGDVTYQIGYPASDARGTYNGYFPFSELSFPLDAVFGVVDVEAVIINKYVLGLKVKKNVSDPNDNMEDRDWITVSDPYQLDIYSESKITDFSAFVLDVDVSYRFLNNDKVVLAAGVGYMHQDFEYTTALIRQWSPSGYRGYDFVGDGGTSLIYEVDFNMPYLMVDGRFNIIPALRVNGRFAFAPWMKVEDKDQHLLRSKVNTGDLDGSAIMLSAEAEYDFTPQLFVTAGLDYTYITADGDMDAAFYGVYDHTVSEEIESNQASLYATIGFRFGVSESR